MAGITTGSILHKEEWFEKFFRFGLISKGIVYCLLGILTVMTAVGLRGDNAGKEEAFKMIYDQPFGKILLALLSLGLFGYVTLRLFQCFKDIDKKGNDFKGIMARAGYGISALIYMTLGIYAVKLLMNGSSGKGGGSQEFVVSKILNWPAGQWIIGIVAVIIIINGIRQIYKGVSGKFMKDIKLVQSNFKKSFKNTGIIGYTSRGIMLGIIGYLLLHAASTSNPKEAKGTEYAFDFLEHEFGSMLMGVVAFGFIAYGVFMFVKARYQKMEFTF